MTELSAEAWNARYERGQTGWDRGDAAPALHQLLARIEHAPLRVLVPGAGFGHDAIAWARAGFQVTAVDFAPLAVAGLRERAAAAHVVLEALHADLFALPAELSGTFDLVWEQTCLCAIEPSLRDDYVDVLHRVLKPSGLVHALLWNHQRAGGPPFDLPVPLTHALFKPRFDLLETTRLKDSGRAGEYLLTLRRP